MTTIPITKIQILADKATGHPIFYAHSDDRDHKPEFMVEKVGLHVLLQSKQTLFKLKANPQTKSRVDIYMSIQNARELGRELVKVASSEAAPEWSASTANPGLAPKGVMKLPEIIWSKCGPFLKAGARVRTGLVLKKTNGYVYVELEYPDASHIKMKEYEVHTVFHLI
jgi:hypothetical protein